jgi:GNAT superfamily N-acetyltransferase
MSGRLPRAHVQLQCGLPVQEFSFPPAACPRPAPAERSRVAFVGMRVEPDVFVCQWRGDFENGEVNRLHAEGFEHPLLAIDWRTQLDRHSLGWVCARRWNQLVGFLNVAWDDGAHAFIVDTVVSRSARHAGIGTELVSVATQQARRAGCEWLHVDFEGHLPGFYLGACRFAETQAGLINLQTSG